MISFDPPVSNGGATGAPDQSGIAGDARQVGRRARVAWTAERSAMARWISAGVTSPITCSAASSTAIALASPLASASMDRAASSPAWTRGTLGPGAVYGHEYGLRWNVGDRRALVAWLRTL